MDWIKKIESAFNEPSDSGLSKALSKYWESWSELGTNPESFATRSNVINRTQNLTNQLNLLDEKFEIFSDEIDFVLEQQVDQINNLTKEIAQVNREIFNIEAGNKSKANTLHDRRDAAMDELSKYTDATYRKAKNGMVNVFINGHPAVVEDSVELLETQSNSLDTSEIELIWEFGDRFDNSESGGSLSGVLAIRDTIIPGYQAELDSFTSTLISETNRIYANGVSLKGKTIQESRLGYEALGVSSENDALSLISTGQTGSMKVSFYDSNKKLIRTEGIVIHPGDSLSDIQQKLDAVHGLDARLLSSQDNDGRLSVNIDSISGENTLGEVTYTITDPGQGYDTSGFLDLLGFSQTGKSTNTSSTAPLLESRDLTELQTVLGLSSIADVRAEELNLAGRFTINAFETATETSGLTDGNLVQQLYIDVASSDSIDDIIAKVNALTSSFGVSMSFNSTTNKLELTSSSQTDADGNLSSSGTNYLRMSFANDYRYPQVTTDKAPANHNGRGDNTNLLATLQFNTLFQGNDAGTITLDSNIIGSDDLNAAYILSAGANGLALDLNNLQNARVTNDNQFTLGEQYENLIADVGSDIQEVDHLATNETLLLESFLTERDRISGVSLDEELAKMIQFQRSYDANARMLSTFDRMAEEILRLI